MLVQISDPHTNIRQVRGSAALGTDTVRTEQNAFNVSHSLREDTRKGGTSKANQTSCSFMAITERRNTASTVRKGPDMTKDEDKAPARDWWDETDNGSWNTVVQDAGERIKWIGTRERPDVFVGKLTAIDQINMDDQRTGLNKTVPQFIFEMKTGKRANTLGNYQLTKLLKDGKLKVGQVVKITHYGLMDIGNGQTMNTYDVQVRTV